MRASKTIHIGGDSEAGRDVEVREMSVDQLLAAPTVLGLVCSGQADALVLTLLMDQDSALAKTLLPDMSSLGPDIRAIGGEGLLDVLAAWAEVNTAFFGKLRSVWDKVNAPGNAAAPPVPTPVPKEQAA
jgi:hypothetical protein